MNTKQQINSIGLGSFFNETKKDDLPNFDTSFFLNNYELFYTGRHAIKYLLQNLIEESKDATIWLPKYYCQHVTYWLQQSFSAIQFYNINAFSKKGENINILEFAAETDIVILNNFWGVFNYSIPATEKRPIIIEDHSHGWLSNSCLNSNADYCFASLRKTLPIPLGGILWRPNGKELNIKKKFFKDDLKFYNNWDSIANAMQLKTNYAKNTTLNSKETYLSLITNAEMYLHNQYDLINLKPEHTAYIEGFINKDYNYSKKEHLDFIYTFLNFSENFKILNYKSLVTFGLQLAFKDREVFTSLKRYLVKNHIYPSELWPGNQITNDYSFLLNIHVDFRYNLEEIKYIVNSINNWIKENN